MQYALAFLIFVSPVFAGAPKLPQPPNPTPIPTPPAPVPSVPQLNADQLYVFDDDIQYIVLSSPPGLVKVTEDAGPIKIRGKFVYGNGGVETRTYKGKFVYSVEAVATGRTELIIIPVGAKSEKDIVRQLIDSNTGPAPPPPPPVNSYTITSSDGAVIPFAPATSLDAAKAASDAYANTHPGISVIVKDWNGVVVYTAYVDPNPAPIPAPGLHVLMVYDAAKISPAEQPVLYSKQVYDYMTSKAPVGPDGKTAEWRIFASNADLSNESQLWKDAFALKRDALPWIVVSNGKTGYKGPLPKTVDAMMTLLKKYGG